MHIRISCRGQGFDKHELTRTSRTLLGFSTHDAEQLTALISTGEAVELNLSEANADQFVRRIRRLGLTAESWH